MVRAEHVATPRLRTPLPVDLFENARGRFSKMFFSTTRFNETSPPGPPMPNAHAAARPSTSHSTADEHTDTPRSNAASDCAGIANDQHGTEQREKRMSIHRPTLSGAGLFQKGGVETDTRTNHPS